MKTKFFIFTFLSGIICFNLFAQINQRLNNNFESFSTNSSFQNSSNLNNSFDNFDSAPFDNSFNSPPFDNSFNSPPFDNSFNPPFDSSFNPPFDNSFNKPFDNNFNNQPLDTTFNFSDNNFDNSFNQSFDSNFNNPPFDDSFNQPADNLFGSRSTRRFERNAQPDFMPQPPLICSNDAKQQLNQQLINVYQILEDLKVIVQTQESIEDKKNTSRFLRNQLKELIEKIKLNEMVKANPKFLANYFDTVLQNYQKFDDFFDITNLNNLYDAFKTIKLNLGLDLSTLSAFLPN